MSWSEDGVPEGYLKTPASRRQFNAFGKQDAAQKNGAIAVLVIQNDFPRKNVMGGNRGTMYLDPYKKLIRPNLFIFLQKWHRPSWGRIMPPKKFGTKPSKTYPANVMLQFNKTTSELQSSDVLGFLEGTDLKDKVSVISAHYDHREKGILSFIMARMMMVRERSVCLKSRKLLPKQKRKAKDLAEVYYF